MRQNKKKKPHAEIIWAHLGKGKAQLQRRNTHPSPSSRGHSELQQPRRPDPSSELKRRMAAQERQKRSEGFLKEVTREQVSRMGWNEMDGRRGSWVSVGHEVLLRGRSKGGGEGCLWDLGRPSCVAQGLRGPGHTGP